MSRLIQTGPEKFLSAKQAETLADWLERQPQKTVDEHHILNIYPQDNLRQYARYVRSKKTSIVVMRFFLGVMSFLCFALAFYALQSGQHPLFIESLLLAIYTRLI